MIWWLQDNECTGCLACENICKSDAITISENAEGFLFPTIDESRCIDCKACQNVCPVEKAKLSQSFYHDGTREDVYAGWVPPERRRTPPYCREAGGVFARALSELTGGSPWN